MEKIIKSIEFGQAKAIAEKCAYALLYKIESIDLVKISEGVNIEELLVECYEARFFDEEREVRILRDDDDADMTGEFGAAVIEEADAGVCIRQDKKYVLANRYKGIGKSVIIRQYLLPDEDGQMCVMVTRLVGIEV